jgi:hypothetical protein
MVELTPPQVEEKLRVLVIDLEQAEAMLAAARDEEVARKHDFKRARRRALLSAKCPKVSRDGVTVAERDAWVEERCSEEMEALGLASVKREAAEDHVKTVRDQSFVVAGLAKSVNNRYGYAGRGEH